MKQINVYFDDESHQMLLKLKRKLSWHDFIILMADHCKQAIKRGDLKLPKK